MYYLGSEIERHAGAVYYRNFNALKHTLQVLGAGFPDWEAE